MHPLGEIKSFWMLETDVTSSFGGFWDKAQQESPCDFLDTDPPYTDAGEVAERYRRCLSASRVYVHSEWTSGLVTAAFCGAGARRIDAVKTQDAVSLGTDACQSATRPVLIKIRKW